MLNSIDNFLGIKVANFRQYLAKLCNYVLIAAGSIGLLMCVSNIEGTILLVKESLFSLSDFLFNAYDLPSTEEERLHILLGTIVFAFSIMIVLMVISLRHIRKTKKRELPQNIKQDKYQRFFINLLSTNPTNPKIALENAQEQTFLSIEDLTNTSNRKLILKELKSLHSCLAGYEKIRIREFYKALGFIDDLNRRLVHGSWLEKVEAINEVKEFELIELLPKLEENLQDSNENIALAALAVYVEFAKQPIEALQFLNKSLNRWEINIISDKYDKVDKSLIPDFISLIDKYPLHEKFLLELADVYDGSDKIKKSAQILSSVEISNDIIEYERKRKLHSKSIIPKKPKKKDTTINQSKADKLEVMYNDLKFSKMDYAIEHLKIKQKYANKEINKKLTTIHNSNSLNNDQLELYLKSRHKKLPFRKINSP